MASVGRILHGFCTQRGASRPSCAGSNGGRGHPSTSSSGEESREERRREGLAGWLLGGGEGRAKSLNVPQQQQRRHRELRRGRAMARGRASVPVQRAKVALRGGAYVSFLIFAASVHYPGRLKTRALISPSSSAPLRLPPPSAHCCKHKD